MSAAFVCGATGCGTPVTAIYCDDHKDHIGEVRTPPPVHVGETVHFTYRGTDKSGIVEKVMRTRCVVLIEVRGGKKKKLITVDFTDLQPGPH